MYRGVALIAFALFFRSIATLDASLFYLTFSSFINENELDIRANVISRLNLKCCIILSDQSFPGYGRCRLRSDFR